MDTRTLKRTAIAMVGALGVGLAMLALFLLSWTPTNTQNAESLRSK